MSNTTRVGMEALAKRCGVKSESIRATFETITALMEEGRTVTIPGFGKFEPRFTEPRTFNSPIIPEGTTAPRRRKVRFTMSDTLRKKWILEARGE